MKIEEAISLARTFGNRDAEDAIERYGTPISEIPWPNLSGEFADDLTPRRLCERIGIGFFAVEPEEVDAICEAYEEGVDYIRGGLIDEDEE